MPQPEPFHKFSGLCSVTFCLDAVFHQKILYVIVYANLSQLAQEVLNVIDNINAIMTQHHNSKVAKTMEQHWSGTLSGDSLSDGAELGKALEPEK